MSKLELYNGIKTDLLTISEIKHVDLFNSQFDNEDKEHAFLYPAVFIQFLNSSYTDNGKIVNQQNVNQTIRLHICFESYKDTDTDILTLVDTIWQKLHLKRYGDWSKLLRRNEEHSADHPNVQVFYQDYETVGFEQYVIDTTTATLTPVINATINTITEI